jgi:hypothetical protein
LIAKGVVRCSEADRPAEPADPATTSALPGAGRFVAQDHFRETVSSRGSVQISWIGAIFRQRFLSKSEERDSGAFLRRFEVRKSARDTEIIAALSIHHETKLADLWCLLSAQPNGELGVLLTNGTPNVFYIRDSTSNLLAVDAVWGGSGWEIGASAIDSPSRWLPGRQVIAR